MKRMPMKRMPIENNAGGSPLIGISILYYPLSGEHVTMVDKYSHAGDGITQRSMGYCRWKLVLERWGDCVCSLIPA